MPRINPAPVPYECPEVEELGPKMQALAKDQWRLFCWRYTLSGGKAERSAIEAGYEPSNAAATATRLLQRPDVLEALQECAWQTMHSLAVVAVGALEDIIRDPSHKDRMKAIEGVLSRTGFIAKTGHETTVTHKLDQKSVDDRIAALASELGIDASKLLGKAKLLESLPLVEDAQVIDSEIDPEIADLF